MYTPHPYHDPTTSAPPALAWLPILWLQVTATPNLNCVVPIGQLFEEVATPRWIVRRCALRTEQLGPVLYSTARSVSDC